MIRLDRARGDHHLRALFLRLRDEELQFAGLVPAKSQSRLVVALNEYARSAKRGGETRQFFDGGWEMGEVEAGDLIHGDSSLGNWRLVNGNW